MGMWEKFNAFSMALQIAVLHLLPSEKDLTMKFYPVISMIMVDMSY